MEDTVVAEGEEEGRREELRISYRATGARIERVKLLAEPQKKQHPSSLRCGKRFGEVGNKFFSDREPSSGF